MRRSPRLWLALVLAVACTLNLPLVSAQWCQTGVQPLPNLTALLPSTSYHYYGAADDECSSFYFSAIAADGSWASAASPSVLLRADEALNVTLVSRQPIPTALLAAGYRYITDMEYFNLRLFAPITSALPLAAYDAHAATATSRHRIRAADGAAANASSGIAVMSTSNLTLLQWYPLPRSVAVQCIAIDYADSTLYAAPAASVTALLHFAIDAAGGLSPLPDIRLASLPPFTAIRGTALYYPAGLLFYVDWAGSGGGGGGAGGYGGGVVLYDVKGDVWSSVLNATTALPVTSMVDLWSTSEPSFGSLHVIDGSSLYNFDMC